MFGSLLAKLKAEPDEMEDKGVYRRRHARRSDDYCVGVIAGTTYPVENWSPGGLMIYGDSRPFAVQGQVEVTMKFRVRDNVVDVPHMAKVVRKGYDRVAFEFLPLTSEISKFFQSVIDDHLAAEFAESQQV